LFDGTLAGWVVENSDGSNFVVEDGVLRVSGPEGWLRSEGRYADFRLRVEFRFLTEDADSGVYVRAQTDELFIRGWPNRTYQVQLRNPAGTSPFPPVGGLFRHGLPDGPIRFDPADSARLSKPAGEWQTLEIEAVGERLAVRLNDEALMEAEGLVNPDGHIGLQGEAGAVEIRAIAIEEL
jgi:hypothetical protein